jgi:hypothetical protein
MAEVRSYLREQKREAGWVPVDDMDIEIAIVEAIQPMSPKTAYEEKGIPVLAYLKQHGYIVMQSKADADAITSALNGTKATSA